MELGRIERIDPRTYWSHEAHDFTPWLRDNIALLGEALGIEIDPAVKREVSVGPFSADLLGTDLGSGATILVENQLEPTDHSHLGQLLTYASGLDARIIVWVSRLFRDEHRQALTWLNECTPEDLHFFGVQIELVRIGDSALAPDLQVVVMPSEWQKRAAATTRTSQLTDRQQRYKAFWEALIRGILERDPGFTTSKPERAPYQSWCGFTSGRSGFAVNAAFSQEPGVGSVLKAELYIDSGDWGTNKRAFDCLLEERASIEAQCGWNLEWTRRDTIRASRVYVTTPGGIEDTSLIDQHLPWFIDRVMRLREVFAPLVRALDLNALVDDASGPAAPAS